MIPSWHSIVYSHVAGIDSCNTQHDSIYTSNNQTNRYQHTQHDSCYSPVHVPLMVSFLFPFVYTGLPLRLFVTLT